MKLQRWMIDVSALGAASAGVVILFVIGVSLGFIYARQGNWFAVLWYAGWPLVGLFVIYRFCKKIKFF